MRHTRKRATPKSGEFQERKLTYGFGSGTKEKHAAQWRFVSFAM
jgi:hypothetical protein